MHKKKICDLRKPLEAAVGLAVHLHKSKTDLPGYLIGKPIGIALRK